MYINISQIRATGQLAAAAAATQLSDGLIPFGVCTTFYGARGGISCFGENYDARKSGSLSRTQIYPIYMCYIWFTLLYSHVIVPETRCDMG